MQAKGLLLAVDEMANEEIAGTCETTPDMVRAATVADHKDTVARIWRI